MDEGKRVGRDGVWRGIDPLIYAIQSPNCFDKKKSSQQSLIPCLPFLPLIKCTPHIPSLKSLYVTNLTWTADLPHITSNLTHRRVPYNEPHTLHKHLPMYMAPTSVRMRANIRVMESQNFHYWSTKMIWMLSLLLAGSIITAFLNVMRTLLLFKTHEDSNHVKEYIIIKYLVGEKIIFDSVRQLIFSR